MTKQINLKAIIRENKEKPNKLRQAGFIPAVLYGSKFKNQNLKINLNDFEKVWEEAGEFSLIDLEIKDKKPVKVIIKEVQRDVTKNTPIHLDLYVVDMSEKITVEIPLILKGEAPAVKELGGTLVKNKDYLRVECLPGNLINEIEIELDSLKEFNDMIRANDIKLPEGVNIVGEAEDVLINIAAPRKEVTTEEEIKEVSEEEAEPAKQPEKELESKEDDKPDKKEEQPQDKE